MIPIFLLSENRIWSVPITITYTRNNNLEFQYNKHGVCAYWTRTGSLFDFERQFNHYVKRNPCLRVHSANNGLVKNSSKTKASASFEFFPVITSENKAEKITYGKKEALSSVPNNRHEYFFEKMPSFKRKKRELCPPKLCLQDRTIGKFLWKHNPSIVTFVYRTRQFRLTKGVVVCDKWAESVRQTRMFVCLSRRDVTLETFENRRSMSDFYFCLMIWDIFFKWTAATYIRSDLVSCFLMSDRLFYRMLDWAVWFFYEL